jgi:hypothetical protein
MKAENIYIIIIKRKTNIKEHVLFKNILENSLGSII